MSNVGIVLIRDSHSTTPHVASVRDNDELLSTHSQLLASSAGMLAGAGTGLLAATATSSWRRRSSRVGMAMSAAFVFSTATLAFTTTRRSLLNSSLEAIWRRNDQARRESLRNALISSNAQVVVN
ncbi:hypothetical protein HDU96_006859 [Phlyctochytrium bullatum]|nr:hypothetical protein HDU96_006859 [Phlyctochytrium bullatum]